MKGSLTGGCGHTVLCSGAGSLVLSSLGKGANACNGAIPVTLGLAKHFLELLPYSLSRSKGEDEQETQSCYFFLVA